LAQGARKSLLICACYTGGDGARNVRADTRNAANARCDAIAFGVLSASHVLAVMVNIAFI